MCNLNVLSLSDSYDTTGVLEELTSVPFSVENHFTASVMSLQVPHHTMQLSSQNTSVNILRESLFVCVGADCEDLNKLEGGVAPGRPSRAGGQSQLWHACRCVGHWHIDL